MRIALLSAVLAVLVLGPTAAAGPQQSGSYTVSVSVSGSGHVTSSPAGINCPGTCSHAFKPGDSVALSKNADTGWNFSGWGGDCSGNGSCTLRADQRQPQRDGDLRPRPEDALHAHRDDQWERIRRQQPRRNRLPGHLLGGLRRGHAGHARPDRGRRRGLRQLGRGLLGCRRLHRHDERRRLRLGDFQRPPHAAARDAARHRTRASPTGAHRGRRSSSCCRSPASRPTTSGSTGSTATR